MSTAEKTGAWVEGWNRPGCLPDIDCTHAFAEWADAATSLADDMRAWADDCDEEADDPDADTRAHVDAALSVDGLRTWPVGTDFATVIIDPHGHAWVWWIQWSDTATPDVDG